jgi:Predicted nucleotidyltransferases
VVRTADLHIDHERLAELCRRFGVSKLEVFGSFANGNADASSDVDVLVTFAPGESLGLGIVEFQQALEDLLGRTVDLLTRDSVERSANKYFRRFVLRSTELLYEAA